LFIDFGRERAAEGAGPMTLGVDIGAIKMVLSHAAAVHGLRPARSRQEQRLQRVRHALGPLLDG
jgi:hypothetical protein